MSLLEIRNSRKQALTMLALGVAVLAGKALFPEIAGDILSLGGVIALFLSAFGAYQLVDRGVQLELSDYGLTDHRTHVGTIPWEAILQARAGKGRKPRFVTLETREQVWGGPKVIKVRTQGLEVPPDKLAELINQRAKGAA